MKPLAIVATLLLLPAWLGSAAAGELAPNGRNLAAPPETAQLDFFVGDWEVRDFRGGSDGSTVGRMAARYVLDGYVLQADYRGLDPDGNVTFRGTSLRFWDPVRGKLLMRWAVANAFEYTLIVGEMVDGELVSTGEGRDSRGSEFIERYRFFEIRDDSFRFEMERSFDGGDTWFRFADIRYQRNE